jgi:hypothetical protein
MRRAQASCDRLTSRAALERAGAEFIGRRLLAIGLGLSELGVALLTRRT